MTDGKHRRLTPHERSQMEYKEYVGKLDADDARYIKQFYEEYYAELTSNLEPNERIINTKEMIQEARRIHNNYKTDMFDIGQRTGTLEYADEDKEFMETASKEWEWRDAYAIGGEELAYQAVMYQARNELIEETDNNKGWMIILARMYIKLNSLRKLIERQRRRNSRSKK